MNTMVGEIVAQKSQTGGFGEKSGSFGNKRIAGEFESILTSLLGGQSLVQSGTLNQSSQIESESASVAVTDSPYGNQTQGNHLMANNQQGILVSLSDGASDQANQIDQVYHNTASGVPQTRISRIPISFIQGQRTSGVNNTIVEIDFINSVLRMTDGLGDGKEITEPVKANVSQGWMIHSALAKEDAIASNLKLTGAQIDIAPNKVSSESKAALLEEVLFASIFNRSAIGEGGGAGEDTISTPNQDAKTISSISSAAVESRQILEGNGIDAMLSLTSPQTDSQESKALTFLDSRANTNAVSKMDSDEISPQGLKPSAGGDLPTSLDRFVADRIQFDRDDQLVLALQTRSGLARVLDTQHGASKAVDEKVGIHQTGFRLQGGTNEPSPCDVKKNVELMWRMDSKGISFQGSEHSAGIHPQISLERHLSLTDAIQFNVRNQSGLAPTIQISSREGLGFEGASGVNDEQVKLPFQFGISNRKQVDDANPFLPGGLRAVSKAFDEIGSLSQNPKETALCHQIFDKVIEGIQKGIPEKHQASLKISTDDGKRIHVDISLMSNQVRVRISVGDAELRDLLASHGWLLVQRFEASGLVAQQVEFSLLGEKQFGESHRERRWAWGQSSVDDLEEVGGDYETMVVNSSSFDSFA